MRAGWNLYPVTIDPLAGFIQLWFHDGRGGASADPGRLACTRPAHACGMHPGTSRCFSPSWRLHPDAEMYFVRNYHRDGVFYKAVSFLLNTLAGIKKVPVPSVTNARTSASRVALRSLCWPCCASAPVPGVPAPWLPCISHPGRVSCVLKPSPLPVLHGNPSASGCTPPSVRRLQPSDKALLYFSILLNVCGRRALLRCTLNPRGGAGAVPVDHRGRPNGLRHQDA